MTAKISIWWAKKKKIPNLPTHFFPPTCYSKHRSDITEPGHEKMFLVSYANNKGADQPAHLRSLISAFVVRCLDSIISLDSIAEISSLYLASVAAQAVCVWPGRKLPKTRFVISWLN